MSTAGEDRDANRASERRRREEEKLAKAQYHMLKQATNQIKKNSFHLLEPTDLSSPHMEDDKARKRADASSMPPSSSSPSSTPPVALADSGVVFESAPSPFPLPEGGALVAQQHHQAPRWKRWIGLGRGGNDGAGGGGGGGGRRNGRRDGVRRTSSFEEDGGASDGGDDAAMTTTTTPTGKGSRFALARNGSWDSDGGGSDGGSKPRRSPGIADGTSNKSPRGSSLGRLTFTDGPTSAEKKAARRIKQEERKKELEIKLEERRREVSSVRE